MDGKAYRDFGPTSFDPTSNRLVLDVPVGPNHPFHIDAYAPFAEKIAGFRGTAKGQLKELVHPAGLVSALLDERPFQYDPEPWDDKKREWVEPNEIARQSESYDGRIARFVLVGDRLMLREDVPMMRMAGEPDEPILEVVIAADITDPVSMNRSIGYSPKSFGYFGMEEFDQALEFAAKMSDGWLCEQRVEVGFACATIPRRDYADMSLVYTAESMRRHFVGRIASPSHNPSVRFSDMEQALGSIATETFARFKRLADGLAAWKASGDVTAIAIVIEEILGDANGRSVFCFTEAVASVADMTLARWDNGSLDLASLAHSESVRRGAAIVDTGSTIN